MPKRALASLLLLISTPVFCAPEGPVRIRELRDHVRHLASDELAGRDTGEPGIARAEEYIAAAFAHYGLRPLPGEDDFFVDLTLFRHGWDGAATSIEIERDGAWCAGDAGVDFRPLPFSGAGVVEGEVVFAGYGITSEEHGWDDFADLDVRGKIVLVLRHEPDETDPMSSFDGTRFTEHAEFEAKARNAGRHGARAMLLVTDPLHHDPGDSLPLGEWLRLESDEPGGAADEPFLSVHISRGLAADVLGDVDLAELQRAVDDGRPASEVAVTGAKVKLRVIPRQTAKVPARNVAAFLAGSDPRLRDQWIVIGGHHDHLGSLGDDGEGGDRVATDHVFNGADDNASGTAGVLALARAFAARAAAGEGPRRSLVFLTFTGEERGLLGSRAMVEQRRLSVDRTVFMLNLDMIGRNPDGALRVVGDGFTDGLHELVEEANDGIGIELAFSGTEIMPASDHHPFYRADIPFLTLFTGLHDDYHRLGDDADKLAYPRMRDILRLAYRLVSRLASAPEPPRFLAPPEADDPGP